MSLPAKESAFAKVPPATSPTSTGTPEVQTGNAHKNGISGNCSPPVIEINHWCKCFFPMEHCMDPVQLRLLVSNFLSLLSSAWQPLQEARAWLSLLIKCSRIHNELMPGSLPRADVIQCGTTCVPEPCPCCVPVSKYGVTHWQHHSISMGTANFPSQDSLEWSWLCRRGSAEGIGAGNGSTFGKAAL